MVQLCYKCINGFSIIFLKTYIYNSVRKLSENFLRDVDGWTRSWGQGAVVEALWAAACLSGWCWRRRLVTLWLGRTYLPFRKKKVTLMHLYCFQHQFNDKTNWTFLFSNNRWAHRVLMSRNDTSSPQGRGWDPCHLLRLLVEHGRLHQRTSQSLKENLSHVNYNNEGYINGDCLQEKFWFLN